ncbi:MAG: acyl-CoA dehydrogenase family protein [Actinomycetota bacterium]
MTTVVEEAKRLDPEIRSRADASEEGRRLDPEMAKLIRDAGLFGMCVPRRYGGGEATAREVVDTISTVARADGAAGWCVMIAATTGLLAGTLGERWAEEIYGADPRVVTGGVTAPLGRAERVDGGWQVTGRWPYGSGSQHSDWLVGGTLLPTEGDGRPDVHLMFFPADEVTIHTDTWRTSGLRGTGSHDISVDGAFVPDGRSVRLGSRPTADGALYAFSTFGLLSLGVASVSLGIARRALDELIDLAGAKTPTGSRRTLAKREVVQAQVGMAEATWRSAVDYVHAAVERAWEVAERGERISRDLRLDLRLAASNATRRSAEVVDQCWNVAGASAVYEDSVLQRCFRDVHVTTQHIMVAPPTFELAGRIQLGLIDDDPVL